MTAQRDRTEEVVEAMAMAIYNENFRGFKEPRVNEEGWLRMAAAKNHPGSPVGQARSYANDAFKGLPSDIRAAIRGEGNG